jgi:hypothetical protein
MNRSPTKSDSLHELHAYPKRVDVRCILEKRAIQRLLVKALKTQAGR